MDIYIYLLFQRGSLIYSIARPHFLWLRLRYIKAHGDLGVFGLSYFFINKNKLNTKVIYNGQLFFNPFFKKFVCVLYVNPGSKLSYFLALKFLPLAPILKRGNTIFLMENQMGLQN